MAKYMQRAFPSGLVTEATPVVVSTGNADAARIVQTNGVGRLDQSLLPEGIGADTFTSTAAGALTAGDAVYITAAGTIARASAAAGGNKAIGFVLVASAAAAAATIYFEGRNTALTGLTPGARYYLSDATPGGVTNAAVSGAGKLHQYLGSAVTATSLNWEPDDLILLEA